MPGRWRRRALYTVVLWMAALAAFAAWGGCTSEDPNPVGAGLGQTAIDTVLRALTRDQMSHLGVLDVVEPTAPLDGTEVLYLGSTGRDASSILVNYDFSVFAHPDSAYLLPYLLPDDDGQTKIAEVNILLYLLSWYEPYRGATPPDPEDTDYTPLVKEWLGARKYYDIHALFAPFDSLAYPGPEPAFEASPLNPRPTEPAVNAGTIRVNCIKSRFETWIANRAHVGLIIREGWDSEPGLLGFASKEMRHGGSTLPVLSAATTLGAALELRLEPQPPSWPASRRSLLIGPAADVSTWHELEDPCTDPDEGIMLRTHVRSYPVVQFDLSGLPANVRINRANLVVVNDTSRSLGHRNVITCSEIRLDFAPPGRTTVNLSDIEPEIYLLFGNGTWEPEHLTEHELSLNVTESVQRYVNNAYSGTRGFLLAAGESIFPGWRSDPKPDFWFTKWVFHGALAAPELRPRLEISYTRLDELTGGKDQP
ncbi:MAG: hypothetical protein RBT60_03240 [Candidatus Krumholzibacteria bacterium]|nr:hypothetical protein [Candidatus Krumholzibacteria bacterium]